ncbi:hypothetical protein D3C87_1325410 [compost metagenome]
MNINLKNVIAGAAVGVVALGCYTVVGKLVNSGKLLIKLGTASSELVAKFDGIIAEHKSTGAEGWDAAAREQLQQMWYRKTVGELQQCSQYDVVTKSLFQRFERKLYLKPTPTEPTLGDDTPEQSE